ncbi:MAG: NADH-quinone oxidoreductase subunit C [Candidatus Marsarchaeota archaeon]|jgi:NADH-quinone oxidoreductase subunit C|nr:NADH-quinone oxidoreductase subunit C [Candidatus Marsarchaeota archaeon]
MKAKGFDYLSKITAVDYVSYLEAVYILYNTDSKQMEVLRVKLDAQNPEVDSVMELYKAADWYEREMSEMFGIRIAGRQNIKRLLLREWNGSEPPLRKSFVWGKNDYKRLP